MITWLELTAILNRPIAFHRIFATVGGGAIPGLFLSQAFYWTSRVKNPEGWFYKTQKEWTDETALTRSEQERARRQLKKNGLIEEKKEGLPCKVFYRINKIALLQQIFQLISANSDAGSGKQECRNLQTGSLISANSGAGSDKQSIYTETTSEITSETTSPLTPQGEQGKDGKESNPEEDGKRQEARGNTQACSLAGKLETQIEQRSRLINPESKDSASRRENGSHFQQCDNSAFVGHGQLAPDGKQRPYNQMKGCYRSVGSDPWMKSSRNPLPEFKKWVYEQAIADGRKYSEANAAAEIRNDCDRAEDLWEKYQQYRQPRSTPRYEVVTEPLPKPVPLIDRNPELRKKAEETLQNLRKNAK